MPLCLLESDVTVEILPTTHHIWRLEKICKSLGFSRHVQSSLFCCQDHAAQDIIGHSITLRQRASDFPSDMQWITSRFVLFISIISDFLSIITTMLPQFFFFAFILLLRIPKTNFISCNFSDYDGPNGSVVLQGYHLQDPCEINIQVPFGRRAVLEIKKLKIVGKMPSCEDGHLEIRVG